MFHLILKSFSLLPLLVQEEKRECAALLYAGMEAGWLRPVVGSQYTLDKAAQAHHDIIESPGAAGKMILNVWWHDVEQCSSDHVHFMPNAYLLDAYLQATHCLIIHSEG